MADDPEPAGAGQDAHEGGSSGDGHIFPGSQSQQSSGPAPASGPPPGGYPPGGYGGRPGPGYGAPSGHAAPPGHAPYSPYPSYGGYGPPYSPHGGFGPPPAPKPGIIPLRPLGVGEILDGAFSVIRWNPKAVLVPSAVVATVASVVYAVATFFIERDIRANFVFGPRSDTLSPSQTGQLGAVELAAGGADLLIGMLSSVILTVIVAAVIGPAVLGRKETLDGAWRAARSRVGPAIAARVLAAVFVGGGWLLAVGLSAGIGFALGAGAHLVPLGVLVGVLGGLAATVFAVVVWNRWTLSVPAVMLERAGPLKGMGRSWRLVRGSWWRVWGILLLTQLIVGLASLLIRVPFLVGDGGLGIFAGRPTAGGPVVGLTLVAVSRIISGTLLSPLSAGVTVLLYADLRMRREGIDITMQASAATGSELPGAPPRQGPAGQGPASQGPPRQEPAGQGPARQGPADPGPGGPGTQSPGAQGPGAQGPGTQGPGTQGPPAW